MNVQATVNIQAKMHSGGRDGVIYLLILRANSDGMYGDWLTWYANLYEALKP